MDSIILVNGKGTGGNEKTVAIIGWFFAGYNLADTIVALSPKHIIIYASDRKRKDSPIQWPSSTTSRRTKPPKSIILSFCPKLKTPTLLSKIFGRNYTVPTPTLESA